MYGKHHKLPRNQELQQGVSQRLRWLRGSVLVFSTQVRGFKHDRSRRSFKGENILSTPSFGGEVKPSVLYRRFTARKGTLECIVEVGISRQNYRSSFSPTNRSTFRGETSGGKSGNRILYRASTISLQAAVYSKYTLGALNVKEEEGVSRLGKFSGNSTHFVAQRKKSTR